MFGEEEDSDDSDDIFSKKSSKNLFAPEVHLGFQATKTEVSNKQKNLNVENVQNISTMKTSTPETNDKNKIVFEDEDGASDLFRAASKPSNSVDDVSFGGAKKVSINYIKLFYFFRFKI